MADRFPTAAFPTALQRTSDERWVTLDVVARDGARAVAHVAEAPEQTAVLRADADARFDAHLRRLLASPPPDAGRDVHLAWPVDLLHDMDGLVVGYTALRPTATSSLPLADLVDPVRRTAVAPGTTRRHLLRAARNVAAATAALHHAGHGGIRGGQFRVDDRARVIVVQVDRLADGGPAHLAAVRAQDESRLGHLMVRLLAGQPAAMSGELADLLARATAGRGETASAQDWFFALHAAERALPRVAVAAAHPGPADGIGSDEPGRPPAGGAAAGHRTLREALVGRTGALDPSGGPEARIGSGTHPDVVGGARSGGPEARIGSGTHPDVAEAPPVRPTRRPAPTPVRAEAVPIPGPARRLVALATGLTVGAVASVAPFAAFAAVAAAAVLGRSIDVGRRKATRGPHQLLAITASRLVPFATGGFALAAFILLDLLLLLGLCMAVAARVFEYGPGFTLTWILQLPEVPGLVRAFSFLVGLGGGLAVGGQLHDRVRSSAAARRRLVLPAVAMAVAALTLLADAPVLWWPIPPSA